MSKLKTDFVKRVFSVFLAVIMVTGVMPITVFAATKSTVETIFPKTFTAGVQTEFEVKTTANDDAGIYVVGSSVFSDPDAVGSLEYYEVKNGSWYALTGDFGPSTGFPMSDATSKFRVTFNVPGIYTCNIIMKKADGSGETVCESGETTVNVVCDSTISVDASASNFVVNEPTEFKVNIQKGSMKNVKVKGTIMFDGIKAAESLEFFDGKEWIASDGDFGGSGFELSDSDLLFRALFADAGKHSLTASLKYADGKHAGEVLCSSETAQIYVKSRSTVSVAPVGKGSVMINGVDSKSISAVEGEEVIVDLKADDGWQIASVNINGEKQTDTGENEYSKKITVGTDNTSISVVFVKVYKVSVKVNGAGSAETSPASDGGIVTVASGKEITVTAVPNENYRVVKVEADGKEPIEFSDNEYAYGKTPYKYTLSPDKDCSVTVTFAPVVFNVTVKKSDNGKASAGNTKIDYDGSAVVTITPDDGFAVDSVIVNVNGTDTEMKDFVAETDKDNVFTLALNNICEDKIVNVTYKACGAASSSDFSFNSSEACRTDIGETEEMYVFAKKESAKAVFSTEKQGIRITAENGNVYGGKNTRAVVISENTVIVKIELRYDLGWHTVLEKGKFNNIIVTFDGGKPETSVKPKTDPNSKGFYTSDFNIELSATDGGDYFSGLSLLSYRIECDGVTSSSESFLFNGSKSCTKTISISAAEYNSANVSVFVVAEDKAGNKSDEQKYDLKICTSEPTVSVVFSDAKAEFSDPDSSWYNRERIAELSITDRADVFDATAATNGINVIKTSGGSGVNYSVSKWTHTGNTHTATVTFSDEGEYTWSISYENKAGLKAVDAVFVGENAQTFGIDTTKPVGTVAAKSKNIDQKWNNLLEYLTFGLFESNGTVAVGLDGDAVDNLSGVTSVLWYLSESEEILSETELDALYAEEKFRAEKYEISEEKQFAVYARITDKAGNIAYIGTDGVIYDKTPSSIDVRYKSSNGFFGINDVDNYTVGGKEIYGSKVNISVTDFNTGVTSSGINSISYSLASVPGVEDESGTLFTAAGNDGLKKEWKGFVIIDADKYNDKKVTLTVSAVDNAGNKSDKVFNLPEINIDEISAAVNMSGNAVTVDDGYGWFGEERTAEITIYDRANAFDPDVAINGIVIKKKENEKESVVSHDSEDIEIGEWKNDGSEHTVTITFKNDGKYSWLINYTNKAGNSLAAEKINYGESVSPREFTVDTKAPAGTVEIDRNKWDELLSKITFGIFSNEKGFTVSSHAEDDLSPFKTEYYCHYGTNALDKEALDCLYNSGKFEADVPVLTAEQQVTVYVRFTDNAGNCSYVSSDGHIIDRTAAELSVAVANETENGIYGLSHTDSDGNLWITVSADEAENDETFYSGIAKISYAVKSRNFKDEPYSVTEGVLYSPEQKIGIDNATISKGSLCRRWAGTLEINAATYNKSDVVVEVTVVDNAGNETKKNVKLDIDVTAPVISVKYDNNDVKNNTYYNAERTAMVAFSERRNHFNRSDAEKSIKDNITATKKDGEKVDAAFSISWPEAMQSYDSANPDNDTFTAEILFDSDANYIFSEKFASECVDMAGNKNSVVNIDKDTTAPYAFTVDTTKPTGRVTVNNYNWTTLLEKLTFGLFGKKRANVSIEGYDEISDFDIKYAKTDTDAALSPKEIENLPFKEYMKAFCVEATQGEQFCIYAKFVDRAGNSTVISSDGMIIESSASRVSVEAVDKTNDGIYGLSDVVDYSENGGPTKGIKLHITAEEDAETNSGIASVRYAVEANINGENVITKKAELYAFEYVRDGGDNSNGGILNIFDVNKGEKERDISSVEENTHSVGESMQVPLKDNLCTSWSGDIIIDADANNSSDITVKVTVTDNAGNVSVAETKLDIDVTAPTVKVKFENNSPLKEKYFNAPRKATIEISERSGHFNPEEAKQSIAVTAVAADGKTPVEDAYNVIGWETSDSVDGDPDGTVHTATVEFNRDANYTFDVSYTDKAGNKNSAVNVDESTKAPYAFTVDTKAPVMKVIVNDNFWTKLLDSLTFGLFEIAKAEVSVEASDETSPFKTEYFRTNDPISKTREELDEIYNGGGFSDYFAFEVSPDEQFVVYVRAVDYAGNYDYISSDGVIVDNTEPVITLEAGEPGKVYNSDVSVKVNVSDAETDSIPYSGIAKIEYCIVSGGKETKRDTVFLFDYSREVGENSNGGKLVITDKADGTEKKTQIEGNVPTQAQLCKTWNGTIIVSAADNNNSDTVVYVKVTDNAGKSTESSILLDIDTTAPDIKVEYSDSSAENAKNGYYTQRTAVVSITERTNHFSEADAVRGISVTATNADGRIVNNAFSVSEWTTVEGTAPDDAIHTATVTFAADANYKVGYSYIDKAGNVNTPVNVDGQANSYEFTVDTTAPLGTVTARSAEGREETWSSVVDLLTFGFWSNSKISINSESADATSPIMSIDYYMSVSENAGDRIVVMTKAELDAVDAWKPFSPFDVTENAQFTVYLRIIDCAGNYAYIATNGLIVDEEHPVEESVAPEISVSPAKPVNGIYSDDVKVAIEVVDPMVGGTYSGLKEISFAVYDRACETPDEPTQEGVLFSFSNTNPKQSELLQKWTGEITVSAAKNNSNNIQVIVYATDNASNAVDNSQKESKSYTMIKVDTTAPVIDISYDNNNADSGSFFKADRVATVTVTERNFDAKDVKVTVTNTAGEIPVVVGWTSADGTGNRDNDTHTVRIPFTADGDYTFAIEYTDLAGNKCTGVNFAEGTVAAASFTVDKTLPAVKVEYDNNNAANGRFFKTDRVATVAVTEHNFSVDRIVFSQTASINGTNITVPAASWSHNGDIHTAIIKYSADGDYTFDVTVSDLAGNVSLDADYGSSVAAKAFTVDKRIEIPSISGIENGAAYNDSVIPVISFTDVNFSSYEIKLYRTRFGDKNADVTPQFIKGVSDNESGISGVFNTFENIAENDGIYTLSLSVADLAGNTASTSRTFTVNRFGSVYEYDDYLASIIKDGGQYLKKDDGADAAITKDLIITEYNATGVAAGSLMILITRNGEPTEAKFTAEPAASAAVTVGDSGWYQYQYTIAKENFAEDGEYRITVSSKDINDRPSASVPENSIDSSRNSIKDTIVFTVDTTKPEIRNVEISPDAKFRDGYASVNATSVTVGYSVIDVGGLASVEVLVNGLSQGVVTVGEDSINSFDSSFTVIESNERQTIEIKATDIAGNTIDTASDDFNPGEAYQFRGTLLISTNAFVRFYEDKAMFYGSIGGVIGVTALGGLFIFFARKKKKKDGK